MEGYALPEYGAAAPYVGARHEKKLGKLLTSKASAIAEAAGPAGSAPEVQRQLRSLGRQWEDELVKVQADARAPSLLAHAQYVQAATRRSASMMQVDVLRKEVERYQRLHQRAIELSRKQLERTLSSWLGASKETAFSAWRRLVRDHRAELQAARASSELEHIKATMEEALEELRHEHRQELAMMQRRVDAATGLDEEVARLREQRAGGALKRMLNSKLAKAWGKWHEMHELAKRGRRALKKMLNAKLLASWSRWREMAGEARRMRNKLRQVAARLRNRELHAALNTWLAAVQEAKATKAKLARAALRMMKKTMADGWYTWRANVDDLRSQRSKLNRAALRIKNRKVAVAWVTWQDNARLLVEARNRASRAIARMRNAAMVGAWDRWCEFVREAVELRVKVERHLRKMLNAALFGAFQRWVEMWREAKTQRQLAGRAMRKMLNGRLSRAYDRWVEMWREQKRQRQMLERTSRRLMNLQLSMSFNRWREAVAKLHEAKEKAERTVLRMLNGLMAGAFSRWREFYEECLVSRHKANQVLAKLMHGVLSRAFESWKETYLVNREIRQEELVAERLGQQEREAREAVQREQEKRRRADKMLRRIMNNRLARAFDGWKKKVDVLRQQRERLRAIAKRIMNRKLSMAFDGWVHKYRSLKRQRKQLQAIARRIKNRALAKAYNTWDDHVSTIVRQRNLVNRTLRRILQRRLAAAFAQWIHVAQSQRVGDLEGRVADAEALLLKHMRHNNVVVLPLLRFMERQAEAMTRETYKEVQDLMDYLNPLSRKKDEPSDARMDAETRVVTLVLEEYVRLTDENIVLKEAYMRVKDEKERELAEQKEALEAKMKYEIASIRRQAAVQKVEESYDRAMARGRNQDRWLQVARMSMQDDLEQGKTGEPAKEGKLPNLNPPLGKQGSGNRFTSAAGDARKAAPARPRSAHPSSRSPAVAVPTSSKR